MTPFIRPRSSGLFAVLAILLFVAGCEDSGPTAAKSSTATAAKSADTAARKAITAPPLQAGSKTIAPAPRLAPGTAPGPTPGTPDTRRMAAPPAAAGSVATLPGSVGHLPGSVFDRTRRPAILSEADDPAYNESNLRMMSPTMLSQVLLNSFCTDRTDPDTCIELDHNGENPLIYPYGENMAASVAYYAHPYQIMLGGIDYTYVLDRNRDPSGVTPLLMFNLIDSYCDQLVSNGSVFPDQGSQDATIRYMYRKVRSRPISDAALEGAQGLLTGVIAAATARRAVRAGGPVPDDVVIDKPLTRISSADKKNICRYFFLIDGGFILF